MKKLLPLILIVTLIQSCVIKTVNIYDSEDVEVHLVGSEWEILPNATAKLK